MHTGLLNTLMGLILVMLGQTAYAAGPYTYSADGSEVTDTGTGLVWRRCSEGQAWSGGVCTGTAQAFTHQEALQWAASQSGWRMPTIKELNSIVKRETAISPATDVIAFPGTRFDVHPAYPLYWTSTPNANNASSVWAVNFFNGYAPVSSRTELNYLRLVR